MAFCRNLLHVGLVAFLVVADGSEDKTMVAVTEAVVDAEQKPETKEQKIATAVVDATMNVLKSESNVSKAVTPEMMATAKKDAKETFVKLDEANIGTAAAADAAAKVAVAEVDGASNNSLNKTVKQNTEAAAVAAGKGVADNPVNLAGAMSEAVSTVKKEETSGQVDVNKTKTGVAKMAKEAVSGAVKETEEVVSGAVKETKEVVSGAVKETTTVNGGFCVVFVVVAALAIHSQFDMAPVYKFKTLFGTPQETVYADSVEFDGFTAFREVPYASIP